MATMGSKRDAVIRIHVTQGNKALFSEAASVRGQTLSEFMLESARESAEKTLLDLRVFGLDPEQHDRFVVLLDTPPAPSAEVIARFRRRAAFTE